MEPELRKDMMKKSDNTNATLKAPRVFISYTHESPSHKKWVLMLASDLRRNGVDAVLDQWECKYGSDVTLFMERGISEADRVLMVCTPVYQKKANTAKGGVGYERLVVTAEIAKNIETEKFICVVRRGNKAESIPTFAMSRLFIDFHRNRDYPQQLDALLRDIHKAPLHPKPPMGSSPYKKQSSKRRIILTTASAPQPTRSTKQRPPIGVNPFAPQVIAALNSPPRRHLPDTRTAITHKFDIAGHQGIITVGLFADGTPGEVSIRLLKQGSTIGGLLNAISTLTSVALQYGIPLEALIRLLSHEHFEPSGFTKSPHIRSAFSIIDYVFRWLGYQFIPGFPEFVTHSVGASEEPAQEAEQRSGNVSQP